MNVNNVKYIHICTTLQFFCKFFNAELIIRKSLIASSMAALWHRSYFPAIPLVNNKELG